MSTPAATESTRPWYCPTRWLLPHLTVFHLAVAAGIGAATVGFSALIVVLLLISTNFNLLGWTE